MKQKSKLVNKKSVLFAAESHVLQRIKRIEGAQLVKSSLKVIPRLHCCKGFSDI